MPVELPPLPYAMDALEPHISARTLEFHYGKHHSGYVKKLNKAIDNTDYADLPLETIIQASHEASDARVFNNAAQIWNHSFFWQSMSPEGGGKPGGALGERLRDQYSNVKGFHSAFKKVASSQFGSGWTWLVVDGEDISIENTSNAATPLTEGKHALLTLDLWEHAYYLDFQNKRGDYADTFLTQLINWEFAEQRYQERPR